MLRIEVSPKRKAWLLACSLGSASCSAAICVYTVLELRKPEMVNNPSPILWMFLLFCKLFALGELWLLIDNWYFGKVHTRIIAYSRTLAVLSASRRPRFIKRIDCVAATSGGTAFLLRNGEILKLPFPEQAPMHYEHTFLQPLYALWWPAHPYDDVRRHFDASGARDAGLAVVALAYAVAVVFAISYLITTASWRAALLVVPLLFLMGLALYRIIRRHTRVVRSRHYPLTGAIETGGPYVEN